MNSENGIGKSYTGIDKGHTPVSKILSRKLVWTTPDASIKSAAELMYKEGVSSVVIIDGNTPLGIITDSDLRRVIAEGLDFNLRLEEFLKQKPKSLPTLVTAEGHENLHEVLSKMIEYRIKHTVVMKSGRPVGVVTIGDIAYSLGPFYIHYVISLRKAKDLEEISRIISEFKEGLTEEALEFSKKPEVGRAGYLFETICHVVDTALKTIVKVKGDIPEGLVYAATGSWGRREQFLLTDRDTLAIYKYHEDKSKVKSFIDRLENYLDEVGLPPCRHGYTARNFIFDFDELLRLVEVWGDDPQKFAVNISLLADARVLVGRSEMLESIKERLVNKLYRNRLLLIQSLIYRPPELLFGLPRSIDFKSKVLAPLEYPIRALAITNRILSTSTYERIESLGRNKIISEELCHTLLQTYNIIMRFKIMVQLNSKTSLDLSPLTSAERDLLKNAIKNIKLFQEYVERNFI